MGMRGAAARMQEELAKLEAAKGGPLSPDLEAEAERNWVDRDRKLRSMAECLQTLREEYDLEQTPKARKAQIMGMFGMGRPMVSRAMPVASTV